MIVLGLVVVLGIFLIFGWAISTEMFQQRAWRRRVETGDTAIIAALLEEALATWRRARPPRGMSANLWAGVQGAQLLAVTEDSATISTSADAEFRTEGGQRVPVASALEAAQALASRLVDMMLYDVPNLRLGSIRVDVYSTFTQADGTPVQRPILSTTANRPIADDLAWEALTPAEVLSRFETTVSLAPNGQAQPIDLAPVEGSLPVQPGAGTLTGETTS